MNHQEIMAKAAAWMLTSGWKQKLAKRRNFEQSLFNYTRLA